ncbi:MAG: hypothetical protein ACK2UL_08085, partial [Anaerolineae bacterium]
MAHGEGEGSGAGAPPVTPPDGGGPGSAGPTRLGDEPARDERGGGRRGVKERASRLRALLAVVAVLLVAVSLAIAMRARTTITIDISEGSPGTPAANKGALSEWADGVAGGWGDVADSSAGAGTDGLTSTSETAPAASVETSPGTHIETTSATLSESPPGTSAAANLALAGAASWRKASAHDGGPIPPLDPNLAAKLRTEPPTRDVIDLAVRLGRVQEDVPREPVQTADYVVGDRETFWVHDIQGERYFQIEAVLEYVGDNAYFWSQDGLSLSRESLERGGQTFSDSVIPAVRDFILGQDAADG